MVEVHRAANFRVFLEAHAGSKGLVEALRDLSVVAAEIACRKSLDLALFELLGSLAKQDYRLVVLELEHAEAEKEK